jgi:short-subunit dehydrogenase involved in D-alanine esterification of teichoic acids
MEHFLTIALLSLALWVAFRFKRRREYPLTKQTILITGGSHGIGFELVKMALKAGAKVIVLDRNESKLVHKNFRSFKCDISDSGIVKNIFIGLQKEVHPF